MAVDPQVRTVLDALAAVQPVPLEQMTPPEAREAYLRVVRARQGPGFVPQAVGAVADLDADGVPVRVYTPDGEGPHPALVFFHGGGWTIGSVETHDGACRALCAATDSVVVSVEYRLAPEHPFPAPLEDCWTATRWLAARAEGLGVDPARLAVGGDSAGGGLAAAVALRARDEGLADPDGSGRLVAQLLVYPAVEPRMSHDSVRENAEGWYLTAAGMRWYWDNYLPDPRLHDDPLAAPLRAPDLAGLPPAVVLTAELDPLRDEGDAYADRLRAAGVEVWSRRCPGLVHGFLGMTATVDAARTAVGDASVALRDLLHR